MKTFFLILTVLFSLTANILSISAQNLKKAAKFIKNDERIDEAIKILEEPQIDNPDRTYLLGAAYLQSDLPDKKKALEYLQRIQNPNVLEYLKDHYHYYLAHAQHFNHFFDKAIENYKKYKEILPKDSKRISKIKFTREEVNEFIKECKVGKKLVANSRHVEIYHIGNLINSKYDDQYPVISADERTLIFTRASGKRDPGNKIVLYQNIYVSHKDEKGQWKSPESMGNHVNNSITNNASVGLAPDGSWLFINIEEVSRKHISNIDIHVSMYKNGIWNRHTKKELTGINTKENSETHISITADKSTVFFVRDDHKGSKDIYTSKKESESAWSKPQKLSANINTPYDEESPFITPDGKTLYFSSKGHETMGGFDIFVSHYDEGKKQWGKAENVGYPINTVDDDLHSVWSPDGTRVYLSSIREDTYGKHDIYIVSVPEAKNIGMVINGKILDADSKEPLNAAIIAKEENNNTETTYAYENTGNYSLTLKSNNTYSIWVNKKNYLFASFHIKKIKQEEFLNITENFLLQPLEENKKEILTNISFTDDNKLLPSAMEEIKYLADFIKKHHKYEFIIASHTDNLNRSKSKERADIIVEKLLEEDIDDKRIKAIGYKSDYLIASNETVYGRKSNNRIEYIVVKDHTNFDYGKFFPYNPPKSFECPKENEELLLHHKINFHSWDNNLDKEAIETINELAKLIHQCNHIKKIEVGGHTDNIGSSIYKEKLCYKRAALVVEKLVSKGIKRKRLVIKAYSDTRPLSSNENEEGRKENRRIEFKILELEKKEQEEIDKDQLKGKERDKEKRKEKKLESKNIQRITFSKVVLFPFALDRLTVISKRTLKNFINDLKSYPEILNIEIHTHTDSVGSEELNLELSKRRGERIKNWIIFNSTNIEKEKILIKPFGESKPKYNDGTEEGRKRNRRAELIIYVKM